MRVLPLVVAFLSAALAPVFATSLDPAFTETSFITNSSLGSPTGIAWAPDGSNRLFVIRKGGEVRIVQNGALIGTPWTTVSPVFTNSECGLIGICFDPNFLSNRYVYLFVTVSSSEQQIIRYTDNPGTNLGTSKTTLIPGLPTAGQNHDGGGIGIGPDGRLYWSIGDLGNGTGVDANLTTLAAKVGRAKLDGSPCNDNPFFDNPAAVTPNDYIWARGFRNPFTLTFQPGTGKLWVNCVGTGWEQTFVVGRGDHAGWDDFENNQTGTFLPPVIAYRTNGTTTATIGASGAVRSSGVVTITTTGSHRLRKGGKVTIAGVTAAGFNGAYYVDSVVSSTQFRYVQSGANETSGGGTTATQRLGGCITGGTFYDSTAFPASNRGNFFFGDLNSIDTDGGRIIRATLDANNLISSVEPISNNLGQAVDIATGPDGALYYTRHNGTGVIHRLAHTGTAQNAIVYPTAFNVVEGGTAVFTVRLAQAPASNVSVEIQKNSGSADLNVSAGATLTFTPANWNQLQAVTISAAEDSDLDNDSASFRVITPGLATHDILVNGIDNDEPNLVLSTARLTVAEGSTQTFTVRLANPPPADVTVSTTRTAGDATVTVSGGGSLVFTAANYATPQTVTIAAADDADTTPEVATLTVSAPGETDRIIAVDVIDNDFVAPTFDSTEDTTAVVNATYTYVAHATGNPAPTYALTTAPAGMSIDSSTGLVTWTPTGTGSFNVVIQAANGILPNATQSFTLNVAADAVPTASLTSPPAGGTVSGATAEFFGDGVDDVGTVKGEFFVDGVLLYTDVQNGHYHFGGAHSLWDTTVLTNGPHVLRLRVTDTAGQTGFTERQVFVANGANAWRNEKFTPAEQGMPSISGDLADPDFDGKVNLLEYSADTGPKSSDQSRLPKQTVVEVGGQDYLALEFVIVKWASDLIYRVEATGPLGDTWTQIDPSNPTYRVSLQDDTPSIGLQTVIVRDVVPLGDDPRFMRLRVTTQ